MVEVLTNAFSALSDADPELAATPAWLAALPGLLVALVGVGGVALGASLSGRRARLNSESAKRYEKKTDSYLTAIEPAFQLGDHMRIVVAHSPRGSHDSESDKLAGDALINVIEVRTQLDRHLFQLRVLGSPAVSGAYASLRTRTDAYLADVARQMEADGIFRGAPGKAYLDELERLTTELILAMRRDLGVAG